ncbi:tyrosine-type recombinase/integrase [Marinomonas mediterranea]|uniref:Integrase family protein n=1 Tax=Marinomonas mediterranea (strain ATCC 700492 / JCM 21426 / NBRC 103028 / MMB-1) TaxID=717774 RepID=F2K3Q8_MARM1|nr:tyrosine-type recombinase/integrase [Marinomonas mediterranea]ADZ90157.1 integrase family protein [Marinomonas mediterranea MMB-1]WCN08221.1 tyrosine-type recombinase/integrase [Marinomonas mediterranea]WCN12288.1 tyrosine-type recombinase/integrase [Marinomonas mediterranea]WCN16360.1 tyrosine-type recombinase/integrase [Marinomonas mediterranea MMB-1]
MDSISRIASRYLQFCQKNRKLSGHTLKAYRIDLKQFVECTGVKTSVNAIDKKDLHKFHDYLADSELSQSSIKRKLACIRAMFRWLEQEEEIEVTPFHKFNTSIKLPKRLPRNVNKSDLKRMLTQGRRTLDQKPLKSISDENTGFSYPTSKRDLNKLTGTLALELMLSTGMRVSELVGIQLDDIFLTERKIKIFGKGSRERYVYLPDKEICQLIRHYRKARTIVESDSSNFLLNSRGQPASTQFIRKLIRLLAEQSSTQLHVTPHMLRHSAACELMESGLDIRFVQRLLGHSSISTTEIYTHVTDNVLQTKIEKAKVRSRIMKK